MSFRSFVGIVLLLLAALLFCVNVAYAVDVNTDGLSELQKAELAKMAAQMKERTSETFTVERVNELVQIGRDIAIAFTTVAKELGVAADKFLESTTGKMTLALIVWKVAGQDMLGFVVGSAFLMVFVPLWIYFFRRLCILSSVVVEPVSNSWRVKRTVTYVGNGRLTNEQIATRWVMLLILAVVVVGGLAITL